MSATSLNTLREIGTTQSSWANFLKLIRETSNIHKLPNPILLVSKPRKPALFTLPSPIFSSSKTTRIANTNNFLNFATFQYPNRVLHKSNFNYLQFKWKNSPTNPVFRPDAVHQTWRFRVLTDTGFRQESPEKQKSQENPYTIRHSYKTFRHCFLVTIVFCD